MNTYYCVPVTRISKEESPLIVGIVSLETRHFTSVATNTDDSVATLIIHGIRLCRHANAGASRTEDETRRCRPIDGHGTVLSEGVVLPQAPVTARPRSII